MNRYVTALLFLIVALLGVFVAFVQPRLYSSRDEKIRGSFLLSVDPDKVRSLHIRNGDDIIQINRKGTGWEVSSKGEDRASPEVVAEILTAAENLRVFDKISSDEFRKKLDIKDFGLKRPKQRFALIGDAQPEIWFGNDAAVSGRVYARKQNSQTVYVVPSQLQTLISRPLNAFRDRQLMQWTPDQIRSFVVKRGGGELEIQQVDSIWKISRPLEARADSKKVYKFLDALLGAQILEFVDDDSGDLSRFGIDERSTSITFQPDTGESAAVMRVGSQALGEEGGYYIQFSARHSIFRLPASVVKLLDVSPEELRARSLLHINPDILDRIVIRSGNRSLILSRKEDEWVAREGESEFPVTDKQVQHFLSLLQQQEVKKFLSVPESVLASYGLEHAEASVEFYSLLSENTPEATAGLHKIAALKFSSPREDGSAYARSLDSSEVLLVEPAVLTLVSPDPSHWK